VPSFLGVPKKAKEHDRSWDQEFRLSGSRSSSTFAIFDLRSAILQVRITVEASLWYNIISSS